MDSGGKTYLYSFMGIDESRKAAGIQRSAYRFDLMKAKWSEVSPVPGEAGRLGATAESLNGNVYIFGGFTVDERGRETTLGRVDIYDPARDSYTSGSPLPLPVDDSLSVVWKNRLIFLVSGWSGERAVTDVQYYDPGPDRWARATPIPGPGVFGHAGGLIGDSIVYCDGVKVDLWQEPNFVMSDKCFRGDIDPSNPARITWSEVSPHPGRPRYRMAAGALPDGSRMVFAGGSERAYNYDGMGYDGYEASPATETLLYDFRRDRWFAKGLKSQATMDHRGLVSAGNTLFLIGGMLSSRQVTGGMEGLIQPAAPTKKEAAPRPR